MSNQKKYALAVPVGIPLLIINDTGFLTGGELLKKKIFCLWYCFIFLRAVIDRKKNHDTY